MKKNITIEQMTEMAETFYRNLNAFISMGSMQLIDRAFPEHDGNADADIVANMMILRDSLYGIQRGCDLSIRDLSDVIDDAEKED